MADPTQSSQQQQQQQQQVRPVAVDAHSANLVCIVRGATTNFTNWLTRHGCDVKGASRTHGMDVGRLSMLDMNRLRDLLECHGWRTAFNPTTSRLVSERKAAPLAFVRSIASRPTLRVYSLIEDVVDQFTMWLLRNDCNTTDVFRYTIDIPYLLHHELSQLQDVLECFGWTAWVRIVDDLRCRLSVEHKAAPLVDDDDTDEFRRAWLALDRAERAMPTPIRGGGDGDAKQASISHACDKCKIEVAVKPTKLDKCGHVFCLKCITGVQPNPGCIAQTSCPVCGTHFYFYCMSRLDGVPVNSHLWNARIPEE